MTVRWRGGLAAFFISSVLIGSTAIAATAQALAPGERVRPNGLTTLVRRSPGSGAVAIELWVRCPSDGWTSTEPGIARLAAFSVSEAGSAGKSLRDRVRAAGGDLSVSVFQTATEFAILAPPFAATELQDALLQSVFAHPIDDGALSAAKTRLAEQQAAASSTTVEVLREAAFGALYAAGPMHASTFGDADSVKSASLDSVRQFAADSYVPANVIAVDVGNADTDALDARLGSATIAGGVAKTIPPSTPAAPPATPLVLTPAQADVPGVALAWLGPPIADRRAATAMDFLSDYLADTRAGVLAGAATRAHAGIDFEGQFVTLQSDGAFLVSASGAGIDATAMVASIRSALAPTIAHALGRADFARALSAYEARLLRQMDSPQSLADNFGWYFAEGAPAYAPSATDLTLGGEYFATAGSLTPDYVRDIAQRYLGGPPAIVEVTPNPVKVNVTSEGG